MAVFNSASIAEVTDAYDRATRVLAQTDSWRYGDPLPDYEGALRALATMVGRLPAPGNVHLNVRACRSGEVGAFVVERSTDGAGWAPEMFFYETSSGTHALANARRAAEDWARTYVLGYRAAGASARATSHGYAL